MPWSLSGEELENGAERAIFSEPPFMSRVRVEGGKKSDERWERNAEEGGMETMPKSFF